MGITDTKNTLAWVDECRKRNRNALLNTYTGEWLNVALKIIEQQYKEVQDIRNDQIDASGTQFLELRERNEKLERVAEIAAIVREDVRESTVEYLLAHGWTEYASGFWENPEIGGDYHPDIAIGWELDRALNALDETGG